MHSNYYLTKTILLLSALSLIASCDPKVVKETVYETEEKYIYEEMGDAAFHRRADMILLEVTVPAETRQDDEIYVVGPFNGGELAAYGDTDYRLVRSTEKAGRYGVYLDPGQFVSGKTLADGFWFVSRRDGREMGEDGTEVTHSEVLEVTQRGYVTVACWETRFIPYDETVTHNGPVVYVRNNSGWEDLKLHVSGEAGEVLGAAPGASPKGKVNVSGGKWLYYDLTEAARGKSASLVFGNGTSSLKSLDVKLDDNVFVSVTSSGAEEVMSFPDHVGIRVWVDDKTGWDALALYLWGDVNDLGASWPGLLPSGSLTYKGYTYKYYEIGAEGFGCSENLIFNDNGGGTQLEDYSVTFAEDHPDHFFMVTKAGVAPVDPAARTGTEIELEPKPAVMGHSLFIRDETGWGGVNAYYWGDGYTPIKWPGKALEKTVDIDGTTWYQIEIEEDATGRELSFIFSKDGQTDTRVRKEAFFTLDSDKYIVLTTDAETTLEVDNPTVGATLYILDESGYPALKVYYWWYLEDGKTTSDNAKFPGEDVTATRELDGTVYKIVQLPKELRGKSVNFQLINAESTSTKVKVTFKMDGDIFCRLTATSCTEFDPSGAGGPEYGYTVYIRDESGYPALQVYYWWYLDDGKTTSSGPAFPGEDVTETVEKDGVEYKVLRLLKAADGRSVNFQFVNKENTKTKVKAAFTVDKDLFIALNASKAEIDTSLDVTLYVHNGITSWQEKGYFYLYLYGGNLEPSEYYGGWAGRRSGDPVEKDGETYYVFSIPRGVGKNTKMQFSNDDGETSATRIRIKTPSNVTLAREMYIDLENGNNAPVIR